MAQSMRSLADHLGDLLGGALVQVEAHLRVARAGSSRITSGST